MQDTCTIADDRLEKPTLSAPRRKEREPMILCVDMDAFFASVEQKADPRLRGKPVAVIGSGGRTIVTTASYEARAYGVRTGMNTYEARRACPRLIFVVANNARYTYTCAELEKIYERFTPDVEVYSIDEAFLDITASHHLFGGPVAVASTIKAEIWARFGIACTVGIGHNILIAKLASDMGKPDGLHWLRREDLARALAHLPVDDLWGIGKKTAEKLASLGICTCGELGRAPASLLRSKFGITGEALSLMGRGELERPVSPESQSNQSVKSIGHSLTLPEDVSDRRVIWDWLLRLSEKVCSRARRHGLMGRKVTLTVRYEDFETISRQCTLPEPTADTHEVYRAVLGMLYELKPRARVRLLGVSVGSVVEDSGQEPLMLETRKRRRLFEAMDSINKRFGDSTLTWARLKERPEGKRGGDVISPSWRPGGVRNVGME